MGPQDWSKLSKLQALNCEWQVLTMTSPWCDFSNPGIAVGPWQSLQFVRWVSSMHLCCTRTSLGIPSVQKAQTPSLCLCGAPLQESLTLGLHSLTKRLTWLIPESGRRTETVPLQQQEEQKPWELGCEKQQGDVRNLVWREGLEIPVKSEAQTLTSEGHMLFIIAS